MREGGEGKEEGEFKGGEREKRGKIPRKNSHSKRG